MPETIIAKQCCTCKKIKHVPEFNKSNGRKDGLQCQCRSCSKIHQKQYCKTEKGILARKRHHNSDKYKATKKIYSQTPKRKQYIRKYRATEKYRQLHSEYAKSAKGRSIEKNYRDNHPKRCKAKAKVAYAVKKGYMPRINTQSCCLCDNQAHHYHHHSYEPEHWLDVMPVCRICHKKIHS